MKIKREWIVVLALVPAAMLAPVAQAQFDFGGGSASSSSSKPWDEFKLNPKTRIKLDYRNSSIDAILSMYQKSSGVTIVKDPALTGQFNLTSAKAVPLSEAFAILSATLNLKNFELVKEGNYLIIRQRQQRQQGGGMPSFDPSMFMNNEPKPVLKVYPILHANASQLARVINEVFAQQGGGGNPFAALFGGGGGGGGGNRFGGGGNRGGFGGGGGFNPAQLAGRFGQGQAPQVRASSDDFSNSIIVNAPDQQQIQVRDIIKQLDKETDQPQRSRVFTLKFASADELVTVVQNVLNGNVPRGRGGASAQANQGPAAFFNAIRGTQAGSGQVVSDPRTNSLVVTATDENLDIVGKVVLELDKEVDIQSSTFVFPLNNARADAVSTLLQQAFGIRQGVGNQGQFGRQNNGPTRPNQAAGNQNRGTAGNRGLGANSGSNGVDDAIKSQSNLELDLMESGELLTNIGVTQGFGQGFLGGGGQNRGGAQNRQAQTQTARDSQGRLINVNDLTGQVTAIPDVNTNSLIVVTTPQNAETIKNILSQLDKIPEQVLIETVIVEATLDATNRLGVEWNFTNGLQGPLQDPTATNTSGTNFGLRTANPALDGFRYTLSSRNFTAFLNAIQTDQKFQVLSTPKIFTSNNVQANINISQAVPYVVNSRQDANGIFTFNYEFVDVGIVLTVTPRITSNGFVTMDVTQTANDLQGYTDFNAPIINQRQAETTVSVKDGETVILGGIIRNTVTATVRKIPLLGDIPILGQLFRSNSKISQKTELLVFLTPRIVRDPDEARKLREENERKLSKESQKALEGVRRIDGPKIPPQTNPNAPAAKPGEPIKNSGTTGTGTVSPSKTNGGNG